MVWVTHYTVPGTTNTSQDIRKYGIQGYLQHGEVSGKVTKDKQLFTERVRVQKENTMKGYTIYINKYHTKLKYNGRK